MAKTANLYARIEPQLKNEAEGILDSLGIPASNAITMFYKQIVIQRGLPFNVQLPKNYPVDISNLSEDEMNAELNKGYEEAKAGKTKSAQRVFDSIAKDYNL
jgi:DNA-damage-inducible protein J